MSKTVDLSPFSAFDQKGVWPYISRDDLLRDLAKSLEHPELIAQQPLPGAHVVAEFISKSPHLYITKVHGLWQTGTILFKGRCIHSPCWLRRTKPCSCTHIDAWLFSVSVLNGDSVLETNTFYQWLKHRLENLHLRLLIS